MKKLVFLALSIFTLYGVSSCGKEELSKPALVEHHHSDVQFEQFGRSLQSVAEGYSEDQEFLRRVSDHVNTKGLRNQLPLSFSDASKAEALGQQYLEASERLLHELGLRDVNTLSSDEKVLVATLLYAEYKGLSGSSDKLRGGAITGNSYVDCALSALGIGELSDIASAGLLKYAERQGTKALLKTVAKFAGRSVSALGWGLAAYDFASCIMDIV